MTSLAGASGSRFGFFAAHAFDAGGEGEADQAEDDHALPLGGCVALFDLRFRDRLHGRHGDLQ